MSDKLSQLSAGIKSAMAYEAALARVIEVFYTILISNTDSQRKIARTKSQMPQGYPSKPIPECRGMYMRYIERLEFTPPPVSRPTSFLIYNQRKAAT